MGTAGDGVKPMIDIDLVQLRSLMPYAIAFLSAGDDYGNVKDSVRRWVQEDPMDTLLTVLVGGGVAMYLAEREDNADIATPWDGIRVMATILSHGDASPHVETKVGQTLMTVAQAFGPALAFSAFGPTADEKRAAAADAADAAAVNRAILARLEDIVRLLEADR